MLSFKTSASMLGCGIDSEHVERFARLELEGNEPPPLVYSQNEINHCFTLKDSFIGFCVAFCCKEAIFKALQEPYDFTCCELLWTPSQEQFQCDLAEELCKQYKIKENRAYVEITSDGECIVTAYLLG